MDLRTVRTKAEQMVDHNGRRGSNASYDALALNERVFDLLSATG